MDVSSCQSIQIGIPESSCATGWGSQIGPSTVTGLMLTTREGSEAKSGACCRQMEQKESREEQEGAEGKQERAERNQRGRCERAKQRQPPSPRSRELLTIGE